MNHWSFGEVRSFDTGGFMPNHLDPEQERLVRLRERQLSTRDPGIKKKRFSGMMTERELRTKNTLSVGRVWKAIPHVWRWAFYGLVLGLITLAVLPTLWISDNAWIISILAAALWVILGIMIGSAIDYRENLKDLSS
jgi:hypothetical protein